jgi:hypothetical protein
VPMLVEQARAPPVLGHLDVSGPPCAVCVFALFSSEFASSFEAAVHVVLEQRRRAMS